MEDDKLRLASIEISVGEVIPSFLLKTYEILENAKYADIISWTKNGEGFIVKKVKEFADQVLPIHFRHSNYTSFVRQLNMYDFHKTRQENQENAFKNGMFRRGCKHLLKDIQRKDYKKNKENNKDNDKVTDLKLLDAFKMDKEVHPVNDCQKNQIAKLVHTAIQLEPKVITLANFRKLPTFEPEIIKLLDLLFDVKTLNQRLFDRYNEFQTNFASTFKLQKTTSRMIQDPERGMMKLKSPVQMVEEENKGTYATLLPSSTSQLA